MVVLMLICQSTLVYANSSWRWLSETRPYDVLPLAILLTLAVEILGLCVLAKTKPLKTSLVVILANLLSFAAPYLCLLGDEIYSFSQALENMPFYTVGIIYLMMTLIIEIPVVYFSLQKETVGGKRLFWTILLTNTATTLITAILERLLCYGRW